MYRNSSGGRVAVAPFRGRLPLPLRIDPGRARAFLQAPRRCRTPAWKIGLAQLTKFLCERHTPSFPCLNHARLLGSIPSPHRALQGEAVHQTQGLVWRTPNDAHGLVSPFRDSLSSLT